MIWKGQDVAFPLVFGDRKNLVWEESCMPKRDARVILIIRSTSRDKFWKYISRRSLHRFQNFLMIWKGQDVAFPLVFTDRENLVWGKSCMTKPDARAFLYSYFLDTIFENIFLRRPKSRSSSYRTRTTPHHPTPPHPTLHSTPHHPPPTHTNTHPPDRAAQNWIHCIQVPEFQTSYLRLSKINELWTNSYCLLYHPLGTVMLVFRENTLVFTDQKYKVKFVTGSVKGDMLKR